MSSDLSQAQAELRARQGAGARYDAANAPAETLALARHGNAYLARIVNGLDDVALWDASARPGWSRRRVIAAAALQAREIAQALEDATGQTGDRAETDTAALDLAETLPARALRHLAAHAEVHLNVVWRDLSDAEWDLPLALAAGIVPVRQTPRLHALGLWQAALDLQAGGRLRDVPATLATDMNPSEPQGTPT
ncbi:maleylpyruvate isomerase N-terminal domain-containing protein [Paracoccus sp. 11-3]|uniref:Maleylpyruvate isomerase N-terminal domain-containing protein n=1 Tax=Paracoccus amoyensis TaxID=2760093 RepID=A0A926JBU2_9RHOB|nr:maleylpyruvate isomerase N-terminal domain-containing protein [Paracoccus amoyensis]MBC9247481.1 maleylpyruvate isomerase N-terminal domain-containing protein [Paracoccus amoyensis]